MEAHGGAHLGDAAGGNETVTDKVAFVFEWIARKSGCFGERVDAEGIADEPDAETFEQTTYQIQIAIDTLDQRIESHGEPSEEYRHQILALTEQRRKLVQIIQEMNLVVQEKGKPRVTNTKTE